MKIVKKMLLIICVIIIAVGMFMLGRQGLNYANGYTKNMLIETIKDYMLYEGIATAVVLVYFIVRYSKQGIVKVTVTSVLGIVGAMVLTMAIMAIIRMPISRLFFPIILVTYVASIIILSSYFEENA